jgi:4-diphosphocytidyl-2-C-methyl-D-erythritol kinase
VTGNGQPSGNGNEHAGRREARPSRAVTLKAGCKVNLFLRITGVREDGFHLLDSLFVPLPEPHDLLRLSPGKAPGLRVFCSDPAVNPRDNTLMRAYGLYARAASFAPSLILRMEKRIPSGSGLGGGSSDAATLLTYLNGHAPEPLDGEALRALAARVGADVPFFLQNAPCRVRGIGEILTPCAPSLGKLYLLLLCPPPAVSTSRAYAAWDALPRSPFAPDGLTKKDGAAKGMELCFGYPHNDLERVVFAAYPELALLKGELLRQGAAAAVMSGSGSSMAGLFRERRIAFRAADFFQKRGVRAYRPFSLRKLPKPGESAPVFGGEKRAFRQEKQRTNAGAFQL